MLSPESVRDEDRVDGPLGIATGVLRRRRRSRDHSASPVWCRPSLLPLSHGCGGVLDSHAAILTGSCARLAGAPGSCHNERTTRAGMPRVTTLAGLTGFVDRAISPS